jgi:hypothetical protein
VSDHFPGVSHLLEILLDHLGIHGVHRLDAALYIRMGTTFLWLCAAVPPVIRAAFFSVFRRDRSLRSDAPSWARAPRTLL